MTEPVPDRPHMPVPVSAWVQIPTLRLLVAVADEGGVGAGAKHLGIAQSNASRSVALMERRLGYPLVKRSRNGSSMTTKGALTVEWARNVLAVVDQMDAAVGALVGGARSDGDALRIGASMTVAEYLVPAWIGQLALEQPGLQPVLEVSNSRDVIAKVREGLLPLGFVETPEIPGDVRSSVVQQDQLEVVVWSGHPWAGRSEALWLDELAETPLVEREAGSGTRAALDAIVAQRIPGTRRAHPVAELNSNSAILHSVAAGLGPAVISELAVRHMHDSRIVRIPVAGQALGRDLRAVWYGIREPVGLAGAMLRVAMRRVR